MLGLEGRSSAGLHLDGFLAQGGGRGWSFYREVLGSRGRCWSFYGEGVGCRGGLAPDRDHLARVDCSWAQGGGRGWSFYREVLGSRGRCWSFYGEGPRSRPSGKGRLLMTLLDS